MYKSSPETKQRKNKQENHLSFCEEAYLYFMKSMSLIII